MISGMLPVHRGSVVPVRAGKRVTLTVDGVIAMMRKLEGQGVKRVCV